MTIVSSGILDRKNFYLAGGTGLALQLGHRLSEDLDFFSGSDFISQDILNFLPAKEVKIIDETDNTLHLFLREQKISFLKYPYRLLENFIYYKGCPLASYLDIALMKLIAISQRGAKKDFVDLYTVLKKKNLKLEYLLGLLEEKYQIKYSYLHILRSIGYFQDAENDPMPLMRRKTGFSELSDDEWEEIKWYLVRKQREVIENF